ncbi:26S proteasome non-ATPase regulatory subunit 9-like [Hibiscus syriacus]|uniref:26S proteasome non-ATPase regulatory subunit 9-like n=1 Tax=Hibiscus syriacus TaxID=106335 RepID=A0A6A2YUB7_HIBSY|nr:26S proteasome non-ATPase regulatory subunit 9-like [Hibiscus syriacus]
MDGQCCEYAIRADKLGTRIGLRLRSMNVSDSEARTVLGPAGNKAGALSARKPVSKPVKKVEKSPVESTVVEEEKALPSSTVNSLSPKTHSVSAPSVLRCHEQLLHSNEVREPYTPKPRSVVSDGGLYFPSDGLHQKKRCAWVTPNTDRIHAAFHDEEWGVPVHDDKKLFRLLVLSGALSELTWSAILSKRHTFREVFMDFDPLAVSKLNEKKLITHGSEASSLLSELKLRAIILNARQISKVIGEFGSFDRYIWSFVNHKSIVSSFKYPRQVPVKTPKADVLRKDLVRRGFRSVGPTVIYAFMQAAGITNDHLTSCFRFQECITASEENVIEDMPEEKKLIVRLKQNYPWLLMD